VEKGGYLLVHSGFFFKKKNYGPKKMHTFLTVFIFGLKGMAFCGGDIKWDLESL
jgi:hypothetical protein